MKSSIGFKSLFDRTIPIIMQDRYQVKDLQEILKSYDGDISGIELEDYIEQLQSIEKNFLERITNNLKLSGIKEGAKEEAANILDRIVILGKDTSNYNCHGWSFGCVHNLPLSSNKGDLLDELEGYTYLSEFTNNVDYTIQSFFSQKGKFALKQLSEPKKDVGSVVAYYRKDKVISHTSKYVEKVDWYTYEEKYYKEWYDKDRKFINFDESGTVCTISNYTSKLGMGYLVAHNFEDLVPLYGEDMAFYDLS